MALHETQQEFHTDQNIKWKPVPRADVMQNQITIVHTKKSNLLRSKSFDDNIDLL